MHGKGTKTVVAAWRTLAVGLVGVLIGTLVLSQAFGRGGGGTLSGKLHVDVKPASLSPTNPRELTTVMKCPKGQVALSGGVEFQDPSAANQVRVTTNAPMIGTNGSLATAGPGLAPAPRAWQVHVINQNLTRGVEYDVGVVCANVK